MSSPTINSPQMSFPSLEEINNLIRAIINDSQAGLTNTPGEGQIFTDNPLVSPFVLPMLNSSIREIYRELRNVGDPQLIFDNYVILGLPILDSPTNGPGGCDPTVQTTLSTVGYFDGVQLWPNFQLPSNMLYPTKLWERCTGTNDNFEPMHQVQDGLPGQQQNQVLGKWEWRQNVINFMGATTQRDIRMRFYGSLPQFFSTTMDYNSTFVPIQDSADSIAFKTAVKYARMLGSPGLADLAAEAKEQMFQLKNATTRRAQSTNYKRSPFGNSSGDINSEFFYGSWLLSNQRFNDFRPLRLLRKLFLGI
jgi:hypothetical protein